MRTFFITSVTARRDPLFRDAQRAKLLTETLFHYRAQEKYLLHEYVVMPDHLHALLTPAPDCSLEKAMQLIKGGFSYQLHVRFTVWQESFTNHRIRDAADYERHREYIRMNPVRAGLAQQAEDYTYSSACSACGLDGRPQGLKPHSLHYSTRP